MFDVSWPPAQAAYLLMVVVAMVAFMLVLGWGMLHTRSKGPKER